MSPRDPFDSAQIRPANRFLGPLRAASGTGDGKRMSKCSLESLIFSEISRGELSLGGPFVFWSGIGGV